MEQSTAGYAALFDKMIRNECSPEETDRLTAWLTAAGNRDAAAALISSRMAPPFEADEVGEQVRRRLELHLQIILGQTQPVSPVRRLPFIRKGRWVAAAIIILVAITVWLLPVDHRPAGKMTAQVTLPDAGLATSYIRHILLPDSSEVVLQAGSTLNYPGSFEGDVRMVRLSGEAYFNITGDKKKPFVILAGKLTTTVLGTAFNIRAFPSQKEIVVSVTKGKVKVENEAKLLAVLTSDQQVVYNLPQASAEKKTVDAGALVRDWARQGLVFEGNSFGEIAVILEKRYGVNIRFKNQSLRTCTIRASFDGTESLQHVLAILCRVREASYSMTGNEVTIDGEGCL